ncbi:MAG: hypothetical protein M3Z50_14970 [Actinomycetota bacterium]|nr:hypothetical protein [Actinomycetota bacterium]
MLGPGPRTPEHVGDIRHRVTLEGSLVEWSLAGLGWFAAFLADAGSRLGINGSLLINAESAR